MFGARVEWLVDPIEICSQRNDPAPKEWGQGLAFRHSFNRIGYNVIALIYMCKFEIVNVPL